ncbi:MAG: hypothetical protein ABJB05_00025 [Parafilimonas sp.]
MNEDEIFEKCLEYIHSNNSIKVEWFLQNKLKLLNGDLERRIQIRFLMSPKFIEHDDIGKANGLKRIVFNPHYSEPKWHERNVILHDLLVAIIAAAFSLIVGFLLWKIDKTSKDVEIQNLNTRIDSLINAH